MAPHKKYIMTLKDIKYMNDSFYNKPINKKTKTRIKPVVDAIRLTEKDTVEYRLIMKVLHNGFGLTLAAVIFASGFYLGSKIERLSFEKRAIEAGVGEYIIVDPYTGETGFDFVNPIEINRAFGMTK